MVDSELHRQQYQQWMRLYAPDLFRYAYRITGHRQLAEDLLQETFTEAWKSLKQQKDPDKARAWLFQILRHRHAHYLRDSKGERNNSTLAQAATNVPASGQQLPLDRLAAEDSMQAALNTLSPIIRETFLMVFAQGLTCQETANTLRIPIGTVLSRLDAGRRALRQALQMEQNGSQPS